MCTCGVLGAQEEQRSPSGKGKTGESLFPGMKKQAVDPNCTEETAHDYAPKDPSQQESKQGKNFKEISAWVKIALTKCGFQGKKLKFHMKNIMIQHIIDRFKERYAPAWKYWEAHEGLLQRKIKTAMQRIRKKAEREGQVKLNKKMDQSQKRKAGKTAAAGGDASGGTPSKPAAVGDDSGPSQPAAATLAESESQDDDGDDVVDDEQAVSLEVALHVAAEEQEDEGDDGDEGDEGEGEEDE
jgi:hypothetical protein